MDKEIRKRKFEIKFIIEKEGDLQTAKQQILEELTNKGITEFEVKPLTGRRTDAQNRALHEYFTQLANALNEAGFDIRKTIREGIDIPWTKNSVKEYLWRPVQEAYLKKHSTTELNKTKDIDAVYDIVNRAISERCGVSVPFPSIDELMLT